MLSARPGAFGYAQSPGDAVLSATLNHRGGVVERSRNQRSRNQNPHIMKGYMYILRCADGTYYTGSTKNLTLRLEQHACGEGSNFTKKRLPFELVYVEVFDRIDTAFYREKQIQGWSRAKKEALIAGDKNALHKLAECKNKTHYAYRTRPTDENNGDRGPGGGG
ncbi:MAG: GIY-YIG nuclease family protein [Lentimicrobiaceae bacterium]|nr:GIY-YIG nuclease family protein [Lentimicrobiaceae bacterium]